MEYKAITGLKDVEGRTVTAVIATLHQPDADKDTLRENFFPRHPLASLIVPAHRWGEVHLGKSWSYQRGSEVYSHILFNGTREADSWLEAIRFDFEHTGPGEQPLQRWSWGFKPHDDAQTRTKSGRDLHGRRSGEHGIMLFEVSPVLLASSVGTRTTAIKSQDWRDLYYQRMESRGRLWQPRWQPRQR